MEWTDDVENVLESIRLNSIILSNYHKERYYHYKGHLKYFKLPLILLSSITSVASVGLNNYLTQKTISMLTCCLSLASATIASVELYLGIAKNMENEMLSSRNLQLLSYDIYKTLTLTREHRMVNPKVYLDEKYNEYTKLLENSNLVRRKLLKDALAPIPESMTLKKSVGSNCSNISNASSNEEKSPTFQGSVGLDINL